MTTEELLKPRRKVVEPYPFSPWEVGDVLQMDANNEWHSALTGYCESAKKIVGEEIEKYPHLFRKLEWWEDRAENDLPAYVKLNPINTPPYPVDLFAKVYRWANGNVILELPLGKCVLHATYLLPATESEYNDFLTQTKRHGKI